MKRRDLFKYFRRRQLPGESHLSSGTKDARLGATDLRTNARGVSSILIRAHQDTFDQGCVM
jgi:hypothetical protein